MFGEHSGLSAHELRRRAKIINYALLYGKTAFTLSRDIGVTTEAAKEFIAAYFAGFPSVRAYPRRHDRGSQGQGLRLDALRPAPQRAGHPEPQRHAALGAPSASP